MPVFEPYIPKEYLALKINYCKQQLAALPEVVISHRTIRGVNKLVYMTKHHTYSADSTQGEKLRICMQEREKHLCNLSKYEGLWKSCFRGEPPEDIKPEKKARKCFVNNTESVILNGAFFESLKNDANPYYREHKTHFFNGTYYRSPVEAEIARFYTEQEIPFKYEPEIWLKGLNHPINTDFVILINELDQCKFHEHFGLKNSTDYTRKTATTINNYAGAGLLPGLDLICTYDTDAVPFDIRSFFASFNSMIYASLFTIDNSMP